MEQEFRISIGSKIFNVFLGLLVICVGLVLLMLLYGDRQPLGPAQYFVLVIAVIAFMGGVVIIGNQFKFRVTINDYLIKHVNIFKISEINNNDVKGVRIESKFIVIESDRTKQRIVINNYSDFEDSESMVEYLRNTFTDLNAQDLEREQANILNDETLGFTQQERKTTLARAKHKALAYNIIGAAAGFATIPFDNIPVTLLLYYSR